MILLDAPRSRDEWNWLTRRESEAMNERTNSEMNEASAIVMGLTTTAAGERAAPCLTGPPTADETVYLYNRTHLEYYSAGSVCTDKGLIIIE